tara:strand:+ start:8688 stop:9428 length:741 start_codon:yes stop_codon:yes gene_type:complete
MSNTTNKKPEGLALPEGARSGPNCGVTAMAIAANISFDAAWDLLERLHRDRRGGLLSNIKTKNNMFSKKTKFTGATYDDVREIAYKKIGLKTTKINWKNIFNIAKKSGGHTVLTLKNFVEWGTVKGKTYIVTTTGHVQVVRDGWVIDQGGAKHIDEFNGKNKHINSIHEVGKLKQSKSNSKYADTFLHPISHNDRRKGSFGWHSMQIVINNPGISYEKFISKGGRTRDLDWDIKRNAIKIETVKCK